MPPSPLHVNYSKPNNKNSLSHTHTHTNLHIHAHIHATTSIHTPIQILYRHMFIYYKYSGTWHERWVYMLIHKIVKHIHVSSSLGRKQTNNCFSSSPLVQDPSILLIYFTTFSQILMTSLMNLTSQKHHRTQCLNVWHFGFPQESFAD